MGLGHLALGFLFTARNLASPEMGRLERSFDSLDKRAGLTSKRVGGAFEGLRGRLGAVIGGAAAGLGITALTRQAGNFEEQMASVRASGDMTAQELGDLTKVALDAGLSTQFSPTEAAMGLQELAQAGRNAKEQAAM